MNILGRFRRRQQETRAGYADAVVDALLARAQGSTAVVAGVAAAELSAALVSHGFATARIEPANMVTAALTPSFLAMVGRALILSGELVAMIDVGDGVSLRPASAWDIQGGPSPSTLFYTLQLPGPTMPEQRGIPNAGVVHAKYSVDPARPWEGRGPLERAGLTSKLAANLEQRLGQEAGARVGNLLPIPTDGQDESVAKLRQDLAAMEGQTALVETTAAGFGQGRTQAPRDDWKISRLGANIPEGNVTLRRDAAVAVMGMCGVPPGLFTTSDGTAQRESWRRFLYSTLTPLTDVLAEELGDKLDTPGLTFNLDRLYASDLTGRARAFGSMVQAGLDMGAALELAGLDG